MITDWGGVLTSPIPEVVRSWLVADGIDHDSYTAVLRPWLHGAYAVDGEDVYLLDTLRSEVLWYDDLVASLDSLVAAAREAYRELKPQVAAAAAAQAGE